MRSIVALMIAATITAAGCATSLEVRNPFPRQAKAADTAQLASHEAAAEYPQHATTRETRVSAVVDRDAQTILLINPTDQDLYGVRAWVNGQYVAWVNALPAQRVVKLSAHQFVNNAHSALTLAQTRIETVELQIDGELYRALGPAMAPSESDKPRRGVEFSFPPRRG